MEAAVLEAAVLEAALLEVAAAFERCRSASKQPELKDALRGQRLDKSRKRKFKGNLTDKAGVKHPRKTSISGTAV